MAKFIHKMTAWIFRHAYLTIAIVVAILGTLGVGAMTIGSDFTATNLTLSKAESTKASKIMDKNFGKAPDLAQMKIVFHAKDGKQLSEGDHQKDINDYLDKVSQEPGVAQVAHPDQLQNFDNKKTTAYAQVTFTTKKSKVANSTVKKIQKEANLTRQNRIQTEFSGDVIEAPKSENSTEIVGIAVAFIVLAITFASLFVAGLPILTALISLEITMLLIIVLSNVIKMPSLATSLVSMMGLAVGIDYALFIISRYRQELAKLKQKTIDAFAEQSVANRIDREKMTADSSNVRLQALQNAMGSAGTAVIFAGMTVVVAMLAMNVLGIPFISAMGNAAALGVFIAVLVSMTLLPALLTIFKKLVTPSHQNSALKKMSKLRKVGGWGKIITHHRLCWLIPVITILVVIASPIMHINLGLPNDGEANPHLTERKAYDLQKEAYGEGINNPLVVLVETSSSDESQKVMGKISQLKDVAMVLPGANSTNGKYMMLTIIPKSDANDQKTKKLVSDVRKLSKDDSDLPHLYVTGSTAVNVDVLEAISKALPIFAGIIVIFAFILLMMAFRSLLIPLVAVSGFVLSLGATFGFLIWILQDGHLLDLFQIPSKAAILGFLPILIIGILFGLAMDYEIFLVSRIREIYSQTGDTNEAVREGLKDNGPIVIAALIIMASVFAGFIFAGDGMIKSIGLAFTSGVIFDGLLVRMIIVPAAISLFGRANWYFPKWLDRILPKIDIE
ncbi:MMPL family transporter [Eupransor demetentiae]|uniref:MMPL/SSD domain n=1 Tax=Eupransor demetentiae TaxID=3109584 RepID=A0ABP0ENT5_9LACO|nr:MMPL/SSD domain [Lactobacillaceae bacterium LMG 33000]